MALTDGPEFSRWQEQAETAASVAALASEAGHFEWACFLAEQSAQFSAKGLLHGVGAEAWGHDLTVLIARLAETIGDSWPSHLDEPAARLSRHYIPARYPDAHPSGAPGDHYTDADAEQALSDGAIIRQAVSDTWRNLLEDKE